MRENIKLKYDVLFVVLIKRLNKYLLNIIKLSLKDYLSP